MQLQNNSSDTQRLVEIIDSIDRFEMAIEKAANENTFSIRLLLLEVYRDSLYTASGYSDFKPWVIEFIPKRSYNTVLDWVVSDTMRDTLGNWGINASKWSDHAVLTLRSAPDDLLEEIVRGLPPNPTQAQVKDAVDYVKPSNLVTFPSGNKPTPTPKTRSSGLSPKEAKETDEIIQGNRGKMIDLEQKANNWEQKAIALEQKNLELSQSPKPSSDSEDVATADLQGFSQLQDQLKDAGIERAELHTLLNNQAEEINRLTKAIASKEISSESIDDFAPDDKKIVAKQANRIEQLEAQVERLNQQLSDRSSTDIERKLSIAQHQIKSLESMIDCFGNPELEQRILNAVPKDEAEVLQFELNQAIALIDKQGAIVLNLEKSQKELKAEKSKLAMDNLQLAQKVQSLEELLKVPTPKAITAPAQITRPLPLPEVIVEAIGECEKERYSAIVDRCPEGFAVAIGGKSTIFVDAEDVADYLFASLEQSMMTA